MNNKRLRLPYHLRMRLIVFSGHICDINRLVYNTGVSRIYETNDSHMSSGFLHLW